MDFRTQGQTGLRVYAVGNGFVSRVRTSFWGYGKSLYLKLADGNSIVYGHLMGFTPEIDRFISNQQIREKKYYQDINFAPDQFPVRRGDIIAISGKSGVGYPHLHMEIRDKNNIPVNPMNSFYRFPDSAPPIVLRLAIKRFRSYGIANYHETEFLPVIGKGNEYRLIDTVSIYGQAVFAVNAFDPGNGFSYGIYKATLSVDGKEIFAFARDSLNYLTGSQISYVNDYELQSLAGNNANNGDDDRKTFYRLYCQPEDQQAFYGNYRFPDGIIGADSLAKNPHKILISLYDVNGNASKITLYLKKASLTKPGFHRFTALEKGTNILVDDIPPGVKYEAQVSRKTSSVYQDISCSFDKNSGTLRLPPLGSYKNIRIRIKDQANEFSPWVMIDPNLKESCIQTYADFWEFINIKNDSNQSSLALFRDEVIDKNFLSDNIWQGLAAVQNEDEVSALNIPENDINYFTYLCNSTMTLYSPDSLITLAVDKKVLYGKSVISISAMHPRDGISFAFEILPGQLLFNGQAQLKVNAERILTDLSKSALYIKSSSDWFYKAAIINGSVNCPISGGGDYAFLGDNKPPTISNLTPKNGSSIRNSKPLITCRVTDDLSGLSKETQFEMYIDDNWAPAEYNITTKMYSYQITRPLKPGIHLIKIKVSDNQGNQATALTKFTVLGKY